MLHVLERVLDRLQRPAGARLPARRARQPRAARRRSRCASRSAGSSAIGAGRARACRARPARAAAPTRAAARATPPRSPTGPGPPAPAARSGARSETGGRGRARRAVVQPRSGPRSTNPRPGQVESLQPAQRPPAVQRGPPRASAPPRAPAAAAAPGSGSRSLNACSAEPCGFVSVTRSSQPGVLTERLEVADSSEAQSTRLRRRMATHPPRSDTTPRRPDR